jgi:hypothetical protein
MHGSSPSLAQLAWAVDDEVIHSAHTARTPKNQHQYTITTAFTLR